jgi:hypothetical protein
MIQWCNYYNCWCDEVREVTDRCYECDLECDGCEDMEEIN